MASIVNKMGGLIPLPLRLMIHCIAMHLRFRFWKRPKGFYEREIELLGNYIKPGDTVLDIGANFGYFTKLFSKMVTKSGRVLAFEPNPMTFGHLRFNIFTFGLSNVEAFNFGLGSSDTKTDILIPQRENSFLGLDLGQSFIKPNETPSRKIIMSQSVEIRSLKNANLKIDRIDFVKCDVEGAEFEVIVGMLDLIKKNLPILMVEITECSLQFGHHPNETIAMLKSIGYQAYIFKNKLIAVDEYQSEFINYLFIIP